MWKMLKHIAKTHRKRLIGTFSPVGLENLLMLGYPVFGGWAINAVIAGRVWQALLYALVVFLMWLVGAGTADCRYAHVYADLYRNRRAGCVGTTAAASPAFSGNCTGCPVA